MPFVDVVASVGTLPLAQIVMAVPKLNAGVTFAFTVTDSVTTGAH